ncbi:MAG: nicotinate phosphoribosyltransferase [Vicinamibacteria bacterium]|nr:nicotinate phosphoribosyltransferase [Vicinamibacteria bacterium]
MTRLHDVYRPSLALLTDLYELTMAHGYWKAGVEEDAVFHLFFRRHPFSGGFSVACGLAEAVDYIREYRFSEEDIEYLSTLTGNDGASLFEKEFLQALRGLDPCCDVDAIPEGTIVFPHEPLIRVSGPLLQCQLLETPLLNVVNFQTLVATKAARICLAAQGDPVLEFGLRRAQSAGGGLAASRAAFIGGCEATSNVLAGRLYGIPVRGTHAHSWVMAFDGELEAFDAYARAMPNNCIFLVDTYNTLKGVRNALTVGRRLREQGYDLGGIRLDSGDLAYLSVEARRMLDEEGFVRTAIVASNELDERIIASLKEQGAAVGVWGVGTRLVTGGDEPALGGVYKLGALRRPGGEWRPKIKLSEQAVKTSNPGVLQVRRYVGSEGFVADVIYDETLGIEHGRTMIDPLDSTRRKKLPPAPGYADLLVPIFRSGRVVYQSPEIHAIRERARSQMSLLHSGVKRFVNPHRYPVGLEERLHEMKTRLILEARGLTG